jgi:predicted transposase YbfD/YdcC
MGAVSDWYVGKSRIAALLEHFSQIADTREPWRVAHPLPEVLLLVVCGTITGCDDFDEIADWGEAQLPFLRHFLPFYHGIPSGRWLNILMNRMDPDLFAACFTAWVREIWPDRADQVAIDGKTSRRSHDWGTGKAPLHLVSAFATTQQMVLGQQAVADKTSETTAIPALIERLGADGGLKNALVSIDAVACNAHIAGRIRDAGAHYLLALKGNQPSLRAEAEALFSQNTSVLETTRAVEKGHGRIEHRTVTVCCEVDWLSGERRFPGEWRFPDAATVIQVQAQTQSHNQSHGDTRYFISSAHLSAEEAARAVRGHWAIENQLHWVLDVTFNDDQARCRTGHGAKNMAVVRHFALNLVRGVNDKRSLRRRRRRAGWDPDYLASILCLNIP